MLTGLASSVFSHFIIAHLIIIWALEHKTRACEYKSAGQLFWSNLVAYLTPAVCTKLCRAFWFTSIVSVSLRARVATSSRKNTALVFKFDPALSDSLLLVINMCLLKQKTTRCFPLCIDISERVGSHKSLIAERRVYCSSNSPFCTETHTPTLQTDHGGVVARKHLGASSLSIWPD